MRDAGCGIDRCHDLVIYKMSGSSYGTPQEKGPHYGTDNNNNGIMTRPIGKTLVLRGEGLGGAAAYIATPPPSCNTCALTHSPSLLHRNATTRAISSG